MTVCDFGLSYLRFAMLFKSCGSVINVYNAQVSADIETKFWVTQIPKCHVPFI